MQTRVASAHLFEFRITPGYYFCSRFAANHKFLGFSHANLSGFHRSPHTRVWNIPDQVEFITTLQISLRSLHASRAIPFRQPHYSQLSGTPTNSATPRIVDRSNTDRSMGAATAVHTPNARWTIMTTLRSIFPMRPYFRKPSVSLIGFGRVYENGQRKQPAQLSPMHRGVVGVGELKRMLQDALNPADQGKREWRHGSRVFRVGDKVLQMRNNYTKQVFNGGLGRVVEIDVEEQRVVVNFEGERVEYEFSELDELMHAFAMSVHKSQGSEYCAVVIPIMTQHYMMLQRNLLCTGVTRAKELVVLVGTQLLEV